LQKLNDKKTFRQTLWAGKPYNFFGDYLFNKYSFRVLKLPVNAGLSCPNRDGTTGTGGCIFCSEEGSASPTTRGISSLTAQMTNAINTFRRSYKETKYIAYLQAYSNTYADIDILKKIYDQCTSFPGITGLMIGTRPDCINENILQLIKSYDRPGFELWLELGLQSVHDKSLTFLERGHTWEQTMSAIRLVSKFDINLCTHVILGIPGESWFEMMHTAEVISALDVNGVKIHHLHVIKGTPLELIYRKNNIKLLSLREYISILCDFIERLRPDITIHRLAGDSPEDKLLAPAWGLHKGTVLQAVTDEFNRRSTYQGFLYPDKGELL